MKSTAIQFQHGNDGSWHRPLGVAVVGAGYWGPNLVRNFRASDRWDLVAVCDTDAVRAAKVIGQRSTIEIETSFERLLQREDLDAVAIATPAATHAALVTAALQAGKHVLVEKPLAHSADEARAMLEAARQADRVLMVDHTYCYTPAVRYIRDAIAEGVLGDLLYVDSVRINLGLIQPDVNVFWDLAPHDLSILDVVLPQGLRPDRVLATAPIRSTKRLACKESSHREAPEMTAKTIKAVGNLTQDPELRFADDGTPYMYLTVAVNDYARTDEGDWHQLPTVYWTVPVRGKLAENLAETKGAAVGFHGDPRRRMDRQRRPDPHRAQDHQRRRLARHAPRHRRHHPQSQARRPEPPRRVRRLRSLERMESCQGVRRRGTRSSCVSGRSGWSVRSGPIMSRSGRR